MLFLSGVNGRRERRGERHKSLEEQMLFMKVPGGARGKGGEEEAGMSSVFAGSHTGGSVSCRLSGVRPGVCLQTSHTPGLVALGLLRVRRFQSVSNASSTPRTGLECWALGYGSVRVC